MGALIGVAIVATGGGAIVVLAAAATVATTASIGATVGELAGSLVTDPAGPIRTGVSSVIVGPEHRIAATVYSYVDCDQHSSDVQVAEGSATVWIGAAAQYAARVGDQGTCGFKIAEGCRTVIIGGPTATAAGLSVGNEVPLWAQGLVLVLGLAGGGLGMAVKGLSMGVIAARLSAGFVVGMGGSIGGGWLGGKLFGENSFGQRVFALGGGFLGAMLGDGMVSRSLPASGELAGRMEGPGRGAGDPSIPESKSPTDYHPGQQSGDNNCAPQSAQQIIHEATGRNYSEAEMEQLGQQTGKYDPANGTIPGGEADILRAGGVPAKTMEQTPENIQRSLDQGKGVITGHNAEDLWPGDPNFVDDPNNPISGGHSVHTTEVIRDGEGNVTGYRINDTGTGTAGRIVPADQYHASLDNGPAVVTEAPIRAPREGDITPSLDDATGEPRASSANLSNRGAHPDQAASEAGDPDATLRYNAHRETVAIAAGDTDGAHGYAIENKIIQEKGGSVANGGDVVKAGEEVSYTNSNGDVRNTDIDVETINEVIQIKSGKSMPSPGQMEATELHSDAVGKPIRIMYNQNKVRPNAVRDFQKRYPTPTLEPRTDF